MANKKFHYYIGVQTARGMKFVTGLGANRMAFWNENEKPLEMEYITNADAIVEGLILNGYTAVTVKSRVEITEHFVSLGV